MGRPNRSVRGGRGRGQYRARLMRTDSVRLTPAKWTSALYFATFVALGMNAAALGVSISTFRAHTGASLDTAGTLFTASALGYLGGSLIGGWLIDRRPANPVLAVALLGAASVVAVLPHLRSFTLVFVLQVVLGVGTGVVDVGGNTLIAWVFKIGRAHV